MTINLSNHVIDRFTARFRGCDLMESLKRAKRVATELAKIRKWVQG